MRSLLSLAGLALLCSCLMAAPVPAGTSRLSPEARKQLQADACNYAQSLLSVATQVSSGYVRPVARTELLEAALIGLHEAARQPVPGNLKKELSRLSTDEAVIDYLTQVRERLGVCESLPGRDDLLASCKALLKALDPHSALVTENDRVNQPWGDQPAGLGLELAEHVGVGPQRILRVLPGTPAQKAGLRPGDEILEIDGKPLKGMTPADVAGLIKGKAGSLSRVEVPAPEDPLEPRVMPEPVALRLARPGRKPWKITLEFQAERPESVFGTMRRENNSWDYLADRAQKIAHVRIETLNRGVAADLAEVLARLDKEGVRGLVLDLRWSPGGFLDEAVGVAGLFLPEVPVATIRGRGDQETKYHNTQSKRWTKLPLVVLINEHTSGGSELIAAALQDHGRAVVAGQRSVGKGSVQTCLYVDLPGANIKLTSGEFQRPSGKNLHRRPGLGSRDDWGVRPERDLVCPLSPEYNKRLEGWWQEQTLRPGSDNGILPLDDPSNDPQRQVALAWLRQRLR